MSIVLYLLILWIIYRITTFIWYLLSSWPGVTDSAKLAEEPSPWPITVDRLLNVQTCLGNPGAEFVFRAVIEYRHPHRRVHCYQLQGS